MVKKNFTKAKTLINNIVFSLGALMGTLLTAIILSPAATYADSGAASASESSDNNPYFIVLIALAVIAIFIFIKNRKDGTNSNNNSNTESTTGGTANDAGSNTGVNMNNSVGQHSATGTNSSATETTGSSNSVFGFSQRKSRIPGMYTDESIFLKPGQASNAENSSNGSGISVQNNATDGGVGNADKSMKIYIASPFFNDTECKVLTTVENTLTERGYDIYSPRQHEDRNENAITPEWCEETFYKDRDALDMCDCMLMIYHGNYSDSGTAWECGYFGGKGKPVVVLHVGESSNLMVHISAQANITLKDLETYDFKSLPEKSYSGKAF